MRCWGGRHSSGLCGSTCGAGRSSIPSRRTSSGRSRTCRGGTSTGSGANGSSRPPGWTKQWTPSRKPGTPLSSICRPALRWCFRSRSSCAMPTARRKCGTIRSRCGTSARTSRRGWGRRSGWWGWWSIHGKCTRTSTGRTTGGGSERRVVSRLLWGPRRAARTAPEQRSHGGHDSDERRGTHAEEEPRPRPRDSPLFELCDLVALDRDVTAQARVVGARVRREPFRDEHERIRVHVGHPTGRHGHLAYRDVLQGHLERHGESGNHVRASRRSGAPQHGITEAPAEEQGKENHDRTHNRLRSQGGPRRTGAVPSAIDALPSWPLLLSPQQKTRASVAIAQVCWVPALISAKRYPPVTSCGTGLHGPEAVAPTQVCVGAPPS